MKRVSYYLNIVLFYHPLIHVFFLVKKPLILLYNENRNRDVL